MYLLLRDNKQSGPYSLEDLKTMGLKAYDLVWVEGKSAAWRYPCEVEGLSVFAPAVEEQPFDRFYKKASPAKSPDKVNANSDSISTSVSSPVVSFPVSTPNGEPAATPSSTPQYAGEPSTVPGKRIIYVTMPAGNGQNHAAPIINNRSSRPEPAAEAPAPAPAPPVYRQEAVVNASMAEDNSSQLSVAEASAVEFFPRPKPRRVTRIVKPLAIGLSILALLAAGIFIGLSINKHTLSFPSTIASRTTQTDNQQPKNTTVQQLPVPTVTQDPTPTITTPPSNTPSDSVATIIGQATTTAPLVSHSPRVTLTKEKPAGSKTQGTLPTVTKDSLPGTLSAVRRNALHEDTRGNTPTREASHRNDAEEKTDNSDKDAGVRANIASQVSVGSNGYTVGTFGGIADLQVTVTNRSAYPLDLVVVEVQFIQANKKIYKTENLYFRGIGAGSALMQEAPKSSRGIRVQYKITMINSKELGLSYSGI